MKAIIIEDEKLSAEHLSNLLKRIDPTIQVIATFDSVKKSIAEFQKGITADVVFVDVHLADGLSFEIFNKIQIDTPIIFTTAFDEYAIKAFKLNSVDYLLKPIQEDQLLESIDKLISEKQNQDNAERLTALSENLSENDKEVLCIPNQSGFEYIPIAEIEYIEADGSYVNIYCINKRSKTVSKNLKYFESALLDFSNFIRPHRSYIVNKDFITNYIKSDGGFLILKSDVEIPIARERKQAIQEILK